MTKITSTSAIFFWDIGTEQSKLAGAAPQPMPNVASFACFFVAGKHVLAGPSLGAAKEAVFELLMAQLDARPLWSRIPGVLQRVDRAARMLLWPTLSSLGALSRQSRIRWLSLD